MPQISIFMRLDQVRAWLRFHREISRIVWSLIRINFLLSRNIKSKLNVTNEL